MTRWVMRWALLLASVMGLVVGASSMIGRQLEAPQLAYITDEIMLYDVRVGASTPLTHGLNGSNFLRAWSPDGRYLALEYWKEGEYALALVDARKPHTQNLYRFDTYLRQSSISWSPDSRRMLMVVFDRENARSQACVLSMDDFQWTCPPLDISMSDAVWSPRDDVWAVKYSDGDENCVGLVHVDTLRLEPYACDTRDFFVAPQWDETGARVVYIRFTYHTDESPTVLTIRHIDSESGADQVREYPVDIYIGAQRVRWPKPDQIRFIGGETPYDAVHEGKYYIFDLNSTAVNGFNLPERVLNQHGTHEADIHVSTSPTSVGLPELRVRSLNSHHWHTVSAVSNYTLIWRP